MDDSAIHGIKRQRRLALCTGGEGSVTRRLFVLPLIAALIGLGSAARADDLPQRFIGVWMLEDTMHPGHAETCTRSDYNPGYQTNDRVVLVDRKGLTPMEGGCRIVSIKDGARPYPAQPQITDPVTVRLKCV
jgi:hypothetical protein